MTTTINDDDDDDDDDRGLFLEQEQFPPVDSKSTKTMMTTYSAGINNGISKQEYPSQMSCWVSGSQ